MTAASHDFPNRLLLESYAEKYRLALPERQRASRMGDLLGRQAGSSIEFQDRKDYVAGDDMRHIDWRAYARNDRMTIKLFRQEISPVVDIIADASESMSITEAKSRRRLDLVYLFWLLAKRFGSTVRLFRLGEKLQPLVDPLALMNFQDEAREDPLPLIAGSQIVRPGGIKIFISDLLFPLKPEQLIRHFSGADRLLLIQVVSAFEDDPAREGQVRLEDAETRRTLDVALDKETIEGYKRRLENLRSDLDRLTRSQEGAFAIVREDDSPETMMRSLMRAGMVEA